MAFSSLCFMRSDRRGSLVELTDQGRRAVDRAMELHAAAERQLVGALTATERRTLEQLLGKLLLSVDET